MNEVLEAIVVRLLDALGMEACDVYEVDPDDGSLKLLVSYEDWGFDEDVGSRAHLRPRGVRLERPRGLDASPRRSSTRPTTRG